MKSLITVLSLLIISITVKAQQNPLNAFSCSGKVIYFQTYDFNYNELAELFETTGLKNDLISRGAYVPPQVNQWNEERLSRRFPSRTKHQVDYNAESASDGACAEFLRNEITQYSINPMTPPKLNPLTSQSAKHIVFWWASRTSK